MTTNEAWALGLLLALIALVGCFLFMRGAAGCGTCETFSVATCPEHGLPPAPLRRSLLDPKDCPVCASEAEVRPLPYGQDEGGVHWVECANGEGCCLQGPTRRTRAEAVDVWNRIEVRR